MDSPVFVMQYEQLMSVKHKMALLIIFLFCADNPHLIELQFK